MFGAECLGFPLVILQNWGLPQQMDSRANVDFAFTPPGAKGSIRRRGPRSEHNLAHSRSIEITSCSPPVEGGDDVVTLEVFLQELLTSLVNLGLFCRWAI